MEHLAGLSVPEARNWQPLLCVLDVNMPGFRGIDVLHWIREHDAFASIPVLVCSSSDDAGDIRQAAHFGAQCYAVKYGSPDDWKEVIACAERFSGDRSERFSVPCNLLPKVAG